jgi:hypothetical protein
LTRPERFRRLALALAVLARSVTALAETEPQARAPQAPDSRASTDAGGQPPEKLDRRANVPWHDSVFIWDHSATAETVGIGSDVQSRNPTYEMSFRIAPRYYLLDVERRDLSVRGDLALIREFTDSDTTTRRGEWTFTDAELWLLLNETLYEAPGTKTDFVLRAPSLRLPSSKGSVANGKLLGLGVGVGVDQRVPLAGDRAPLFSGTLLRPRLGYTYQFVRATVPTSDEIDRVRLTPAGRSLPSDQLSGTAFPQHELNASFRAETDVFENFGLVTEVGVRYARRYALAGEERICGVIDTGCVAVESSSDAPRWNVATVFAIEASYLLFEGLILSAGYVNLSGQLGADGQRRSIFYSPDARLSVSATVVLDGIHGALTGKSGAEAASREWAQDSL